ncbi:MAG: hypothetical protein V4631_11675 [Pseudomonadota bacterium]
MPSPLALLVPALAILLAGAAAPCAAEDEALDARVIVPGERDAEWGSYRHAYKAAAFFAAFTRTRPLIQAHMQIRAINKSASLEGLTLRLIGEHTDMMLPVDRLGRAVLPLLKEPYQDDAVLRLNRGKGIYYFSGRYSVRERDDGAYQASALRAACEQLLDAQRASGYRIRLAGKRCVGVRFVYAATEDASPVTLQAGAAAPVVLPLVDGQPFEGNSMANYKIAIYRFADWPAEGELLAARRPLAIGTVYE